MIAEFQQYWQRPIDDTLEMTKKVQMAQQVVMRHLENPPEIVYIGGLVANLRSQQPS